MPGFQIGQLKLHYVVQGTGSAVLFLHELGGSTYTWADVLPSCAAAGFRAVALDMRGAGRSEVPASPYSLADLASDVLALMDALDVPDAFLVGLAVGGLVALEAAITALDRVAGLVLLDTPLLVPKATGAYSRQRAEVVLREGMSSVADRSISRSFPPPVAARCPTAVSAYRTRFLENDPRGYAFASLAVSDADFRTSAPGVDVPALVLVGEHDELFPPEKVLELARALPQATYHCIRGAGHFPPLQTPAEVSDRILRFLEGCAQRGVQA